MNLMLASPLCFCLFLFQNGLEKRQEASKDVLPTWYTAEAQDIVLQKIRYKYKSMDEAAIAIDYSGDDSCIAHVTRGVGGQFDSDSIKAMSKDEVLHLLAWQTQKIPAKFTCEYGEDVVVNNILMLVEYTDTLEEQQWALLILSQDSWLKEIVPWKLAFSSSESPVVYYSHSPTNEDIYRFIDGMRKVENRLFIQDKVEDSEYGKEIIRFVEGAVCRQTWEAVIGEKPTKFFPNRK